MKLPALEKIPSQPSLAEMAFKIIKGAIMSGRLAQNEIYSEVRMAKEIGISKTPLHDALVKLENQGFLRILPKRGFQVIQLTPSQIEDMFEFRILLETKVIEKISPKISPSEKQEIDTILENLTKSRDSIEYQDNDRNFHRYLASLSKNEFIIRSLGQVWDLCDWVGVEILKHGSELGSWIMDHQLIGAHIIRGDTQKAADAMRSHLEKTKSAFLEFTLEKKSSS